ncbi:MAG TPA: GH3 auxin-responsive promoter family protein [Candidatus Obscuribacterales bacterium]
MLKSPDIAIGQLYRRATHVRWFLQAVKNPEAVQLKKLFSMIRANEDTAFGKAHKFERIRTIDDYRRHVPAQKYEDLQPYIDRVRQGETRQLTVEQPFMFATTSGTTADPKFIPITNRHLADYTHAFQIHNYHMIEDFPEAAQGRFLVITSNDEEGLCQSGVPYGAVSGLLNRRQPPLIRRHFAVPYELCKVKNVDAKYYLMLRAALAQDVTAILCCNPSSLLLLADQLKEHAGDLVSDLFDGTIRSAYQPPAQYMDAFARCLTPEKERARELDALLERDGTLVPKVAWPNLRVLVCWKGGPMSFYLDKLPDAYGDIPCRDFGYMASEGRGSIPLTDEGAGGVLALTSHFFEFVSEEEAEKAQPRFLLAHELRQGQRYYIYFTTNAGLYRYNINDLIEVDGFFGTTPVIKFVRKGLGISSITGEKLTEEQVLVAVTMAVRQLSVGEIDHCTVEVELGHPPHYVCFVELSSPLPESVRHQFIRVFDDSLKNQNPEYQDKRMTKRLGEPVLRILPPGTYTKIRQQRVLAGAPEAQVKIPMLSSPSSFSKQLAHLNVF